MRRQRRRLRRLGGEGARPTLQETAPYAGGSPGRRNTLIALDGEQELRTPHDDCLPVMPSPWAMRGHTAVRLAKFEE